MFRTPTGSAAAYRRPLWQSLALGLIGGTVGFLLWYPVAEAFGDGLGAFRAVLALVGLAIVSFVVWRRL